MKINRISRTNKLYPPLLKEISASPKQLYYRGQITEIGICIAMVGSRKNTSYGREVTHNLAYDLAKCGITIVSGLALGIDTYAHQAALEAGGRTIAVMACGLDNTYPATNRGLAERIIKSDGAIVSEYEPGMPPLKQNFPARNRIITGISVAVIITEAADHSGALITANFALEQNRLVMAIPGNITSPNSQGTNNLLKTGAIPITDASDVLAALDLEAPKLKAKTVKPASKEESIILRLLSEGVNDSDDLLEHSGFNATEFNQIISLMEISGKIRSLGAGKWVSR
jgi:DNA processing protein